MGQKWDRLEGKSESKDWQSGGGFSKPGIGDRQTAWPSFSATSRYGTANPTCAECGGRLRGAKKCLCVQPQWKPIGKRRNPENEGLSDTMTGGGMSRHMNAIAEWHSQWLTEVHRVLVPGGTVKAFGGTRTYHRLAAAMESVGFNDIGFESWTHCTGFPKSHSIARALDRSIGAAPDVIGERHGKGLPSGHLNTTGGSLVGAASPKVTYITAPVSPPALQWKAWGTALKPAWEPVVVGTKR